MNTPSAASDPLPAVERDQSRWFLDEVHRHDASLKNYVRHAFPAVRDVDDVVQESYLRVWRRQMAKPISEVTGTVKASVRGFLFQVARRLALDSLRHDRASPVAAVADLGELPVVADQTAVPERVSANQEFQLLLEAVDDLPGRCREVVLLRKFHGLSPSETALKLGISEETVHVQTRRGLQRVQEFLRRRGVIREGQP